MGIYVVETNKNKFGLSPSNNTPLLSSQSDLSGPESIEAWISTEDEITTPTGPNLATARDINPKKFVKSIFAVYHRMGGDQWLLEFAKENEIEFFKCYKS